MPIVWFALVSGLVSLHAVAQQPRGPLPPPDNAKKDSACKEVLKSPNGCNSSESLTTVLKMLLQQDAPGGKRLGEEIPRGMPSGLVLPYGGILGFDAQAVAAEGLVALRVRGGKLDVELRHASSVNVYEVPATSFASGADYRWTLTTRKKVYTAEFSLPDDAKRRRVESRIAALAEFGLDETTRLTFEAAIYDDEDFDSSRDALISQIRKRGR